MEWGTFLGFAVSSLAVVNGLMLLRDHLRDRPILKVEPVHPDTYQWCFSLPNGTYQGQPTRKFGMLVYIGVTSRGLRDVTLNSWHLHLKTVGRKWVELKPMSIPEPQVKLGQSEYAKVWPVLGQKGLSFTGDTTVKSGSSIAGFSYYVAEFYGEDAWNPAIQEGKAFGKIVVNGVYGNEATAKILFARIPLERASKMIPGIEKIDSPTDGLAASQSTSLS